MYFTAPATIANLSVGFDCLGLALNQPYEGLHVTRISTPGIYIDHIYGADISSDSNTNIVSVAAQSMLQKLSHPFGLRIQIYKQVNPGSGLGSSATSAVLGAYAVNYLANTPLSIQEVLASALDGEVLASGVRHADNVAAALWGGLCITQAQAPTTNEINVLHLPIPNWHIVVLYPHIQIQTATARQILPTQVDLTSAVSQVQSMAQFVHACHQKNDLHAAQALQDHLIEVHRIPLQAHFLDVRHHALNAGAIGGGISGSGPASFWICLNSTNAQKVEQEVTKVMQKYNYDYNVFHSQISTHGVQHHHHEIPAIFQLD
jgi:homoserine kinase